MELTRREFATVAAGGLSLLSFPALALNENVRYAHLELPAGAYSRADIARFAAHAATAAGFEAPESHSILSTGSETSRFTGPFAITLYFSRGYLQCGSGNDVVAPESAALPWLLIESRGAQSRTEMSKCVSSPFGNAHFYLHESVRDVRGSSDSQSS